MIRNLAIVMVVLLGVCVTRAEQPPVVTALYPSAGCVPANLLRVYVVFSEPMERGHLRQSVALYDVDNNRVPSPFLNLRTELWTPDQTAVTLVLDPGRIKQGVGPNVMAGAPLKTEGHYRVVIDGPIRAAATRMRPQPSTHDFCVTEPNRTPLSPESWSLEPVTAGTWDPIVLRFDRMMDFGNGPGRIQFLASNGEPVAGTLLFGADNRSFRFVPATSWMNADYRVVLHRDLEDAAGNRFAVAFDTKGRGMTTTVQAQERVFKPD